MTSAPPLPADVAAAVTARWPEVGPAWTTAIEAELHELCALYDARPARAFPARYGYIVEVTTPNGPLIMRASPDPDGMPQGHVAIALANLDVAPHVHELRETATGTWTILDKVEPGTPLADLAPSTAVLDALVALFSKLRNQPSPVPPERSLVAWLRSRLQAGDALTDLPRNATPAPPADRERALAILTDLDQDQTAGLCHGDASPWNILAGPAGNLRLIDPRGLSGDPAYDLAVVALKATPVANPTDLATHLAQETGLDRERTISWLAVASSARV